MTKNMTGGFLVKLQGMRFSIFIILAGVFEMMARTLTSLVPMPRFGFHGVCMGSPPAWILANLFLIPAYFHVKKKLQKKFQSSTS